MIEPLNSQPFCEGADRLLKTTLFRMDGPLAFNTAIPCPDESDEVIGLLTQNIDFISKKITLALAKLSPTFVWWFPFELLVSQAPFDTPFNLYTDALSIPNQGFDPPGACSGMTNLALWYYYNKNAGPKPYE